MRSVVVLIVLTAAFSACEDRPAAPTPLNPAVSLLPSGVVGEIHAGESVRLTIDAGDPACGVESEWRCRLVRVTARSAGALTVEVITETGAVPGAVAIRPWGWCCPSGVAALAVTAGEQVAVDVLVPWDAPGPVTVLVNTSLR